MTDEEGVDPAARPVTETAPPRPDLAAAFSVFYRESIRTLVSFLMWQGARLADATEIAQDTVTLAYQNWERIEHPRAWVRTVASRAYIRRIASIKEDPVAQGDEA